MSCECKEGELGWDVFIPYIAQYVKGAPDGLMAHSARLAAIEFAREANIIERDIYIDAQAGVADYPLETDDCYTVVSIKQVCVNGKPLNPVRDATCGGLCSLRGYRFKAPRDLYIYPAPRQDGDGCIKVTAVVIPGQDACVVDPILYNEFAEMIGDGAVSRILMTKGASWYEPRTADTFLIKFERAKRKAKLNQVKGRSSHPQYMKPVRFV